MAQVLNEARVNSALVASPRVRPHVPRLTEINDRVYFVGILAVTAVFGLASLRWPLMLPITLLVPVIVFAGLVLSPRRLTVVYALIRVFALVWSPNAGIGTGRSGLVIISMLTASRREGGSPTFPRGGS